MVAGFLWYGCTKRQTARVVIEVRLKEGLPRSVRPTRTISEQLLRNQMMSCVIPHSLLLTRYLTVRYEQSRGLISCKALRQSNQCRAAPHQMTMGGWHVTAVLIHDHGFYMLFLSSRRPAMTLSGSVSPVAFWASGVSRRMNTFQRFSSPIVDLPVVQ